MVSNFASIALFKMNRGFLFDRISNRELIMIISKKKGDLRDSQFAWERFSINCKPGLLLIFPSHFMHAACNVCMYCNWSFFFIPNDLHWSQEWPPELGKRRNSSKKRIPMRNLNLACWIIVHNASKERVAKDLTLRENTSALLFAPNNTKKKNHQQMGISLVWWILLFTTKSPKKTKKWAPLGPRYKHIKGKIIPGLERVKMVCAILLVPVL